MSNDSVQSVYNAISHRIRVRHVDLIVKYGLDAVMEAVQFKADCFDGQQLEEIGTSDVSCWVKDIEETLSRQHES